MNLQPNEGLTVVFGALGNCTKTYERDNNPNMVDTAFTPTCNELYIGNLSTVATIDDTIK